jgi:DNA-binding MarR family transcriptional regulator
VSAEDEPSHAPLSRLLWRAHHWFRTGAMSRLAETAPGVTLAHATLLSQLDPAGMTLSALARSIGVSTPAAHQLVHQLAGLGLLKVVPDPGSKRSKLVRLTPRGHGYRRRSLALLSELENELAQRIGQRRVKVLREALEQDWGDPA